MTDIIYYRRPGRDNPAPRIDRLIASKQKSRIWPINTVVETRSVVDGSHPGERLVRMLIMFHSAWRLSITWPDTCPNWPDYRPSPSGAEGQAGSKYWSADEHPSLYPSYLSGGSEMRLLRSTQPVNDGLKGILVKCHNTYVIILSLAKL